MLGTEPTATRARLLIELAVQVGDTRVERGIAMATEAEAIARALGDPEVIQAVLLGVRHIGRHPRRLDEHLQGAIELERLGTSSRSLVPVLAGLNTQALLYLQRSELRTSFERIDRFLRLLGDRSLPFSNCRLGSCARPAPTSTVIWRAPRSSPWKRCLSPRASGILRRVGPPRRWAASVASKLAMPS